MADEMLLVQSKVRDAIKSKVSGGDTVRTSDEFLEALNKQLHGLIEQAMRRAKDNGRATLKAYDL